MTICDVCYDKAGRDMSKLPDMSEALVVCKIAYERTKGYTEKPLTLRKALCLEHLNALLTLLQEDTI